MDRKKQLGSTERRGGRKQVLDGSAAVTPSPVDTKRTKNARRAGEDAINRQFAQSLAQIASPESHKRKKRHVPYSKKTWQEQKEMLDHEAERERKIEEQERQRRDKFPSLDQLPVAELDKVRPSTPRNTTQFLINARQVELSGEKGCESGVYDVQTDEDEDGIDEYGTMNGQTSELLALRDEIRKHHKRVEES